MDNRQSPKQKSHLFSVSTRRKIVTYIILGVGAFISLVPFFLDDLDICDEPG